LQSRRVLLRVAGAWAAAGALALSEAGRAAASPSDGAGEDGVDAAPISRERVVCPMVYPVEGGAAYADGFLACRSGCSRYHLGQDLRAPRHRWLLAAYTGIVTRLVVGYNGGAGNTLWLSGGGWTVKYFHVNNDTPGTDDGRGGFGHAFVHGLHVGQKVRAYQRVARLGDSGNAEGTSPHLHFELWRGGLVYDPRPSLERARINRLRRLGIEV
jgi:murein DD-endopeptidase MepM/ murein hydrolase activator NlpD